MQIYLVVIYIEFYFSLLNNRSQSSLPNQYPRTIYEPSDVVRSPINFDWVLPCRFCTVNQACKFEPKLILHNR